MANEKPEDTEKRNVLVRKYQQYLRLEKGLSPNTYEAYMSDLQKLLTYLESEHINVWETSLKDLQQFAAGLHDIGIHPRSQARILSGIKSFFHFLIITDEIEADPSELLEGPKIGMQLPEVLTIEEIDQLIGAIDRSQYEGKPSTAAACACQSCATSSSATSTSTKASSA